MSTIDADIRQLLEEPHNLATAYDVRDWLLNVEPHVFLRFWSGVRERLSQRLADREYDGEWRVWMSPSAVQKEQSFVAIAPHRTDTSILCFGQRHYTVTAQCLGGESACYFGTFRGAKVSRELDQSLKADQFRPNNFWSGWKYTAAVNLPSFQLSRENVLRLNSDNHSADRRLAQAVTEHLWTLFERYRERLERLNAEIDRADRKPG